MKFRILYLAIAAMLVLSGSALAAEAWEKKLMDQGWVRVKKYLQELSDTTWYGLKSKNEDKKGYIRYIHPDGLRISKIVQNSTYSDYGVRKIRMGQICINWKKDPETRCHTIWKKEKVYMLISQDGIKGSYFYGGKPTTWMVKKGNLENFKVLSGSALAAEAWEKKLMDQGWVKIHVKPGDNADTTWYGHKGINRDYSSRIYYIHPDGKKGSFQFIKGGETHIIAREVKSDGKVCSRYKRFYGDKERCRTVWKKGDLLMSAEKNGDEVGVYTKKKGNLENF